MKIRVIRAEDGRKGMSCKSGRGAEEIALLRRMGQGSSWLSRDGAAGRNLAAIVAAAARLYPGICRRLGKIDEEARIDPDWLARFSHEASLVSAEERQAVFAKILAREAAAPGSHSLGCLALIANLSAADLQLVRRIAALRFSDFAVRLEEDLEAYGIGFDNLMLLEEMRLIRPQRDLVKSFDSQAEDRYITHLISATTVVKVEHDDPGRTLVLPSLRFTRSGHELARALDPEPDANYLVAVTALIRKKGFRTYQAGILSFIGELGIGRHTQFCEIFSLGKTAKRSG